MAKTSGAMNELCERVQAWREQVGGGPGNRIPDELWEQAVRVARVAGLTATARATRLNYDRLKQRSGARHSAAEVAAGPTPTRGRASQLKAKPNAVMRSCGVQRERARDSGAGFVALQVAPRPTGKQTTIELTGRHGERMRVEVHGELDLSSLVHAFRSVQS
jgi:hypothetical protein